MTTRLSTINRWARWLHIYSAAPVLLLMLFYSLTGVLLNHTTWHLGETRQVNQTFDLPEYLLEQDWQTESAHTALSTLSWLDTEHGIHGVDIEIGWELEESLLILTLETPEGSYTVEIYPEDEVAELFVLDLPFLEMLNNLHRGKHVTGFWRFLSDLAGICMFVFCATGLWLLLTNALQRQSTLSWVGLGSIVMVVTIFLMH
jgi:hypothetical protein